MTKDELCQCILKVVSPYEGSAFVVGDGRIAVSCIHVCVPDGANLASPHRVVFEYRSEHHVTPISFDGQFLLSQSDPSNDLAVVELNLPGGLHIPSAQLSLDDQPGKGVVAVGYPEGQTSLKEVPGIIFDEHHVWPVTFDDDTTLEVLQIDTRGRPGFRGDHEVRGGMSGGPIWNKHTGTVIGVIEGKYPRGALTSPPDGYGIQLKHLAACSSTLRLSIKVASPLNATGFKASAKSSSPPLGGTPPILSSPVEYFNRIRLRGKIFRWPRKISFITLNLILTETGTQHCVEAPQYIRVEKFVDLLLAKLSRNAPRGTTLSCAVKRQVGM